MKLSSYIRKLKHIKNEFGDLLCVYAVDDEGNDFHEVLWDPTVGEYDRAKHKFIALGEIEKIDITEMESAVCVN